MAHLNSVFKCVNDPDLTCLQQFLINHSTLTYVHVKPDGDCFFNSIAEYYKRTGEQIRGLDNPTDVVALRKFIIERARLMIDENEDMRQQILTEEPEPQIKKKSAPKKLSQKKEEPAQETNTERLDKIFNKLSERYVYEVPAFDVIVQITPLILNVNLSIYSMTGNIVSNTLHPARNRNGVSTIILYLSGRHYGLLYPAAGPNVRSNAQKIANMQADNNNNNNATQALINRLMYQSNSNQNNEKNENERNAKARKASRNAKPSAAKPSASRKSRIVPSNNENEEFQAALKASRRNSIAEIQRQIAALEMGVNSSVSGSQIAKRNSVSVRRKPRVAVKPSASRKNHNVQNINSLGNHFGRLSIGNQPRVHARAEKKKEFPIGMTVIDVSKDPSKISLKQTLQYFQEIFPGRLTIKSGAKKDELYELFITAKIMEEQLMGNK